MFSALDSGASDPCSGPGRGDATYSKMAADLQYNTIHT